MDKTYTVELSLTSVIKTLVFFAVLGVMWLIRDIVLSFFVALLMAGILYPLVRWAEQKKIPKSLAVGGVLLAVIILGITLVSFLIPAIAEQAQRAIGSMQSVISSDKLGAFSTKLNVQDIVPDAQAIVTRIASSIDLIAQSITSVVIVLVLSFYLLLEESSARQAFKQFIPERYQEFVTKTLWAVIEKLGDWVRGQSALSGIIAASYMIGFTIIGVPYALLLALIAGLLEFIPYIGPFAAAIPAIFFAFAESPWKALATLLFLIVVQQLQNHLIVPMVMKRAVGIKPVVSILSFLIGAKLFGVTGALFAIPVATALSVIVSEYRLAFHREQT